MKSKELQDWLQLFGLFGVVASLVFVGLEMRQAQIIAASQANQARTDATIQLLLESASNPYVMSSAAKIAAGHNETLSHEEITARRLTLVAYLFHYENLYLQFLDGFVSQGRWQGSRENLKSALRATNNYSSRKIFEDSPEAWSEPFRQLIDEILAELRSDNELSDRSD